MVESAKQMGRPSLGKEATIWPLRMRLPVKLGEELERQAVKVNQKPMDLARQDVVAGIERRRKRE